jgi:hypothetical protein
LYSINRQKCSYQDLIGGYKNTIGHTEPLKG